MALYAHAVIEDPETGERYLPGDTVPAKIAGADELKKAGSLDSKKPKDEEAGE